MMRKFGMFAVIITMIAGMVAGTTQQELFAAKMNSKVAFILVYDRNAWNLEEARQLILDTMKQAPGTVKVEMDRDDAANREIVKEYRLQSAPVPLVLVMLPTGIITAGQPASVLTAEKLAGMVPSPKKAEVMQALSDGKAVLLTFSRKEMKANGSINNSCKMACQQMVGNAVHITIDMEDPKEVRFAEEMKIDFAATEPVTVVVNFNGQISGKYRGNVQPATLVASAAKIPGGGCGAQCGPAGCGPKK